MAFIRRVQKNQCTVPDPDAFVAAVATHDE